MADTAFLDQVGLSMATLFPSMGATAAENMDKILLALKPTSSYNKETRAELANGFNLWATCAPAETRANTLDKTVEKFYDVITELALSEDGYSGEYQGNVFVAEKLASSLLTSGQMDQTQVLVCKLSPLAYQALEKILESNAAMTAKPIMQSTKNITNLRTEVCQALVKTLPYMGTLSLPNGFKCVSKILLNKSNPDPLKADAKSAIQTLSNVAKSSLANAGAEILELVKMGGNDQLLFSFLTMPEIYTNNPDAVHNNLDIFMRQQYMSYASIYNTIGAKNPQVLVPHLNYFIGQLTQTPSIGSITIMILKAIASADPDTVYPHTNTVISAAASIPNGSIVLGQFIGAVSSAKGAADICFEHLVSLLEKSEPMGHASILSQISNTMKLLSNIDILVKAMPRISKFKSASEIIFTSIDDFASGRSLETLTNRVDELDARVKALNTKVSETCHNMADVIAYVDANMADMKDFLADVVKKLPKPKRLEVVGTLRKTLILHFECCHTGYEFPITSAEWSKWLKMGFSLVKAGQAIIDIGMGNPLGILKKGVECVQEIYEAYKTNDDDEFNTYITNPFLTSTEQDQLLEKLRDQGFFDVFAYDAQLAGWYLLNPEKDGKPPSGEAGSVSKVWKKEGYGVTEGLIAAAKGLAGDSDLAQVIDITETVVGAVSTLNPLSSDAPDSNNVELTTATSSTSPSKKANPTPVVGGRAAAMKESFGASTIASADEKLASANLTASQNQKISELESKVAQLEQRVNGLTTSLNEVRNQRSSCSCVIC